MIIQEMILKGHRKMGDDTRFAAMFNEYWVYPSENERPQNAHKVEGG